MSKDGNEKKSKKGLIIGIIVAVVIIVILAAAMGGSDDTEYTDDSYTSSESSSKASDDSSSSMADAKGSKRDFTSESEFPLGTGAELDGTIVIMSIAANDANTSWDFDSQEDMATLSEMSHRFYLGLEWIKEQGQKYGKNINFVYDWDQDQDLFYTAQLSADYGDCEAHRDDQKVFIEENLSAYADKLIDRYNADGIVFLYYLNMPSDTNFICFANAFQGTELGMDYPIETMMISKWVYGAEQGPDTYAHELLHVFGAPDLYSVDMDGSNHGITQEFVDYCDQNYKNEIMVTSYDADNMTIPTDHVGSYLSDITAYFIGWIDSCEDCTEYGVANSEH